MKKEEILTTRTGCEALPEDFRARITPSVGSAGPGRAGFLHPSVSPRVCAVPVPRRMPVGGTCKLLGGKAAAFTFASPSGTFIFTHSVPRTQPGHVRVL